MNLDHIFIACVVVSGIATAGVVSFFLKNRKKMTKESPRYFLPKHTPPTIFKMILSRGLEIEELEFYCTISAVPPFGFTVEGNVFGVVADQIRNYSTCRDLTLEEFEKNLDLLAISKEVRARNQSIEENMLLGL